MKKIIIMIMAAASAFSLMAQEQIDVSTRTDKVILFPSGAQLFHSGEVSLPAGNSTLLIKGLAAGLVSPTIRVEGVGDFMIMSVNQQTNYLESPEESKEVTDLRKKIAEIVVKIEDQSTAIDILREKEAFLVANRNITAGNQSISSAEFGLMTEQYMKGIESVRTGVLKNTRILKVLEEEKTRLENQLNSVIHIASLPSNEIIISVSATRNTNAKLTLSYMVVNAGWYPSYDIRVSGTDAPATLFYKANAWQNTGINWKDVLLSFSSARPSISGNIPQLFPWYIDFYNESIRIRGAAAVSAPAKREMAIAESEYEMADEVLSIAQPVTITESGTSFSFDLDIKQDLESGGKASVIELQRLTVPASYSYRAIPKLKQEAFLTADISDWESLNLLDGEANIYFGNTFTGKSNIRKTQLSDTLNISLGNDPGIIVKRENRKEFTETRMIGANRQETRSYIISVRNNRKTEVNINIFDQVPVSRNNQITVEVTELSGASFNKLSGEVKWEITLGPGQFAEMVLTYTVKYPKSQKVIIDN